MLVLLIWHLWGWGDRLYLLSFVEFIKGVLMRKLIVLSMVLIAILVGCSSEPEKTFINTDEVIKALDKQNLIDCEDVDSEMFLSNDTVSCAVDTGDEGNSNSQSGLGGVAFNISTYDDIKQMDLFKEKCKKDDVGVVPDCNEMLEYTFFHSNVMITYLDVFVPQSLTPIAFSEIEFDMRPASKDTIDSILEDLAD